MEERMAKEVFHVARNEGRYQYGLKATFDPQGNVTLAPHTNDHMGSGMDIGEAAAQAIAVQKSHYAGKTVTLDFNGSAIPINAGSDVGSIVASYGSGEYPVKKAAPRRG
jgi:hypothetical protein